MKGLESAENHLVLRWLQTPVDGSQVAGPHVLAGVHSESSHAHVDQHVQEVDHLPPDVVLLQGEVQQADQTTVTHLEQ